MAPASWCVSRSRRTVVALRGERPGEQDERAAPASQERFGLLQRMGGSTLGHLQGESQALAARQTRLNHLRPMPQDQRDRGRIERPGHAQYVLDHWPSGNRVKSLGQGGLHPRALAGRKDDDVDVRHYWSQARFIMPFDKPVDIFGRTPILPGQRRHDSAPSNRRCFDYLTKL